MGFVFLFFFIFGHLRALTLIPVFFIHPVYIFGGIVRLTNNILISLLFSGNWDSIKSEISSSNVLQRDSVMFAKKLGSNMEQFAREKEEEVRIIWSDLCHNILHTHYCKILVHT